MRGNGILNVIQQTGQDHIMQTGTCQRKSGDAEKSFLSLWLSTRTAHRPVLAAKRGSQAPSTVTEDSLGRAYYFGPPSSNTLQQSPKRTPVFSQRLPWLGWCAGTLQGPLTIQLLFKVPSTNRNFLKEQHFRRCWCGSPPQPSSPAHCLPLVLRVLLGILGSWPSSRCLQCPCSSPGGNAFWLSTKIHALPGVSRQSRIYLPAATYTA